MESESRADDETVPDLDGERDGRDDAESVVVIVAAALEDTVEVLDESADVDRAALGLAASDALAFDEIVQSLNLLREAAAVGVASELTENRADCESLAVTVCIDVTLVETEGGAEVKVLAVAAADGEIDGDPLKDAADGDGKMETVGSFDLLGIIDALCITDTACEMDESIVLVPPRDAVDKKDVVETKDGVASNDNDATVDGVIDGECETHKVPEDDTESEGERDSNDDLEKDDEKLADKVGSVDTDGDGADVSLNTELRLGS